MPTIAWSDDLLMHIAEVDKQHKALVDLACRLEQALNGTPSEAEIHEHLIAIFEYAKSHFAAEEAIMANHAEHLPSRAMHIGQHREFEQLAVELLERFTVEGTSLGREVFVFLGTWVLSHIKVVDKAMYTSLRKAGVIA